MVEIHHPNQSETREANHKPATLFGMRLSAFVEIGLFLGIALVIDTLFLDGTHYWQTCPHPFWLIILLVSVQYGTAEGLLAALLATAALLVKNLPAQSLSQDMYDYLFLITRTPLMWLTAALVFGELRMRQLRERQQLRQDLSAAEKHEEAVAAAYKRLTLVKDNLETRVASQLRTAITMFQAAKAIEKLEPGEVLFGVVDIVRAVMSPEKFSLYLLKQDLLEVSIEEGWNTNDNFSQLFPPGSLVFQEVIGRQKVLCSANPEDEHVLANEGVLAGPLLSTETGQVLGMLKIEKLGFLDLNFSNVQTFKILCEWIATAYANAQRYQTARSDSVLNYETQLLSYGFFSRQTGFLSTLAKRIGFDLSMIVMRLENADELTEEERSLIPIALSEAVKKALRKSDLAFDYQRTGWEFAIVLPATPITNAQIVADKLLASLNHHLQGKASQARFSFTTQTLHKENKPEGTEDKLLSQEFISRQTESLANLAKRMGFDLSAIMFRLANADRLTEEQRLLIPGVMSQVIRNLLSSNEPAFAYQRSSLEFAVVLPATSIETAQIIADNLLAALTNHLQDKASEARFSLTIQAIHSQQKRETPYVLHY